MSCGGESDQMSETKKPDRLNVDRKDVDDFNRLKAKDSPFAGSQNKDVFIAAMVTGYHEGSRVKIKRKEGYVRESYLSAEDRALINALAVSEEGNLNVLLDAQKVFSIAEEYATGGIRLLKARVFGEEFGSYTKKLESELLRAYEKVSETQPQESQSLEELESLSIPDLMKNGETDKIEFKSSLIWDFKLKRRNKLSGEIIAKTISCFMNSKGGILLIGVDDEGNALGLENDLAQLKKASLDEFQLHLTNLINSYLGKVNRAFVNTKFEKVNDKDVAAVLVSKSPRPVFVKLKGKKEFYIRAGNSCQPLDIQDANLYIQDQWPDLRG